MNTVENELMEAIKTTPTTLNKNRLNRLETANREYEELIVSGLAEKRGFNLETIDHCHTPLEIKIV